mmetsp:Transcript_14511/g.21389  ORF Transcript_14511/g.21389 Transcript_14511/m.21389 type:complete len:106 (-) Transcript_14511:76-393(-)
MESNNEPKKDERLRVLIQSLRDSGEYDRLYEACRMKLMKCHGWRESLEEMAHEEIHSKANTKDLSLEELILALHKKSLPSEIEEELRRLVNEAINSIGARNITSK